MTINDVGNDSNQENMIGVKSQFAYDPSVKTNQNILSSRMIRIQHEEIPLLDHPTEPRIDKKKTFSPPVPVLYRLQRRSSYLQWKKSLQLRLCTMREQTELLRESVGLVLMVLPLLPVELGMLMTV